jgi:PadR family transcriptional regulator
MAVYPFSPRAPASTSSPAIAGGRVFVGSNDGHVCGLDLASGKKVWEATSPNAKRQQLTASPRKEETFHFHSSSMQREAMKEAKTKSKNELLPGTLEMLILKTLSIESMHGYGIAQHIQMLSADVLTIEEGSLYPALQRMRVKGWLSAEWKISANNRRARFYTLTTAGKKQLGVEQSRFSQMFGAIMRVMKTT